jgi:hypothetical protein
MFGPTQATREWAAHSRHPPQGGIPHLRDYALPAQERGKLGIGQDVSEISWDLIDKDAPIHKTDSVTERHPTILAR